MSSQSMFIKPAPDRVVRDDKTLEKLAPDVAVRKPRSSYWTRRLDDKDVIECPEPQPAPQPEPAPAARREKAKD